MHLALSIKKSMLDPGTTERQTEDPFLINDVIKTLKAVAEGEHRSIMASSRTFLELVTHVKAEVIEMDFSSRWKGTCKGLEELEINYENRNAKHDGTTGPMQQSTYMAADATSEQVASSAGREQGHMQLSKALESSRKDLKVRGVLPQIYQGI